MMSMEHVDCEVLNNETCYLFNEQHLATPCWPTHCRSKLLLSRAFQKGCSMRDGVFLSSLYFTTFIVQTLILYSSSILAWNWVCHSIYSAVLCGNHVFTGRDIWVPAVGDAWIWPACVFLKCAQVWFISKEIPKPAPQKLCNKSAFSLHRKYRDATGLAQIAISKLEKN